MKWIRAYFREFVIIAGISLVGYGCYLIWLPLAPLSVGALFLFIALYPMVKGG